MTSKHSLEHLIDVYCSAWSDPSATRRREILEQVWEDDGVYTDPRGQATGVSEVSALIDKVVSARPGSRVIRTSAVDSHHNFARFAWRVVQADGSMLPESVDFVEVSASGKLRKVVGFFGALEAETRR